MMQVDSGSKNSWKGFQEFFFLEKKLKKKKKKRKKKSKTIYTSASWDLGRVVA